jgi:AmiR/NasT family two-component response regulator
VPPDERADGDEPQHLRVLVADEREVYLDHLSTAVERLGHEVIWHALDTEGVGAATLEHRPDIAIVVLHEDTGHALDLITGIVHEATCPVMVLVTDADRVFIAEAAERGVFAHLDSTDPVELQGAIDVAINRYRQYQRLHEAFERRARIERAKGVLMVARRWASLRFAARPRRTSGCSAGGARTATRRRATSSSRAIARSPRAWRCASAALAMTPTTRSRSLAWRSSRR